MKKLFYTLFLLPAIVAAQPPRPAPTPNDTLHAVRVNADNSVVISLYAPKAAEVSISGDFKGGYPGGKMTRAENGVWTFTTPVLQPDLYTYDLHVDGVKTFDPKNPQYKEAENGFSNLMVVPGAAAEYCAIKDVPHGKLEKVWFSSATMKGVQRMHVYTPPGYENMKGKLPVLYLQHGGGDNDASWSTAGRANFILDNLYVEGKIKPMIVVMPMGHPAPGFRMEVGLQDDPYYSILLTEIIPYMESHYKVSSKREDRAFAGLSMGGLQALNLALFKPEVWGYVLPLSTGYFPQQLKDLEDKHADALKNPEINKLKLFWIAMGGQEDIAYQNGKNCLALFDKFGIRYVTNDYPAAHTFITWRHNLAEFAPLLFK